MKVKDGRAVRSGAAAFALAVTLILVSMSAASAWPWNSRADVYGKSCGSSSVDWVAYAAYSGGSGSVEGIGNDFMIPLTTVPLTGTTLTMTIKCTNGSWHDVNRHINRPSSGFSYGIGWV